MRLGKWSHVTMWFGVRMKPDIHVAILRREILPIWIYWNTCHYCKHNYCYRVLLCAVKHGIFKDWEQKLHLLLQLYLNHRLLEESVSICILQCWYEICYMFNIYHHHTSVPETVRGNHPHCMIRSKPQRFLSTPNNQHDVPAWCKSIGNNRQIVNRC